MMSDGYRPEGARLDASNPPQGGSGVPRKPLSVIVVVISPLEEED